MRKEVSPEDTLYVPQLPEVPALVEVPAPAPTELPSTQQPVLSVEALNSLLFRISSLEAAVLELQKSSKSSVLSSSPAA